MFRLVGCDNLYLFIHEGIPHIVYKGRNLTHFQQDEKYALGDKIGKETNYVDLVNSRYDLHIFNESYTLNKKHDPGLKLELNAVALDVEYRDYNDYYLAILDGKYDSFVNEISVPKAAARAVRTLDGFEYQRFLMDASRAKEDHKFNANKLALDREKQDLEIEISREQYYQEHANKMLTAIVSGLALAAGAVTAIGARGAGGIVGLMAKGAIGASVSGLFKGGLEAGSSAEAHALRLRKFEEADRYIVKERILQDSKLDMDWKRLEQNEKLRIRELGSRDEIPLVNSRGVMQAFNKKKGKGVAHVHLKRYLPSDEQRKLLVDLYGKYGVDVYLPEYTLELNKNIKKGIYQFEFIDAIVHSDPIIQLYVEGIASNGVRVVGVSEWLFD